MYFFQIPWQFDAWPIYQRTFGINSNGFQGKKGIYQCYELHCGETADHERKNIEGYNSEPTII